MNENPCKHGSSPAEFCNICNPDKTSMNYMNEAKVKLLFQVDEQFIEKANKDSIDSHNQKQEILSLQRVVDRQNKLIGELYQQVHGRPMKEAISNPLDKIFERVYEEIDLQAGGPGLSPEQAKTRYFGGRVEPMPLDTPDKPNRFNAFRTASGLETSIYAIPRSVEESMKNPLDAYHHIQDSPKRKCFVCGGHPPKGEYEYCVACDDTGYIQDSHHENPPAHPHSSGRRGPESTG